MIRQSMPDGFERCVEFRAAYDHRPKGGGQHVVEIHVALVGPYGAVSLRIFTGWTWADGELHAAARQLDTFRPAPMGAEMWLHRPAGSACGAQHCDYLGRCTAELLSFSAGDAVFAALVQGGEDALWAALRPWYDRALAEPARAGAH